MRLDFAAERIMAVVAHPDDAECLCAGTLGRAKSDGAAVAICVLCRGDKGQPARQIENLALVRKKEMQAAAELLGSELFEGGFGDGQLVDGPEPRRTLVEIYRRFRPTLVLAHWADDYHSDHRAAGAIAEAASWYSASAGHETESEVLAIQPAVWWMDAMNMSGFEPGFYVDVSDYVGLKRRMLGCHKSQLSRSADGDFSPLEEQMLRQCDARGAQSGVAAAEAFRVHSAWKRTRAW